MTRRISIEPNGPYSLTRTAQRYARFPDPVDRFDGRAYRPIAVGLAFAFLITDYPQPFTHGTKQEHMAVSGGLDHGAEQGSVSKGPQ